MLPFVGCAGWSISRHHAGYFPEEGSHLARYAQRLRAVEVNSCFYRSHRPSTYASWAAQTPADFAFSLKLPKVITHDRRLIDTESGLARFLDETAALGPKRGPILVQLPPSLSFDAKVAGEFLGSLRRRYHGEVACEPRHPSWFAPAAEGLLTSFDIARVAADPPVMGNSAGPGAFSGLVYFRLHGAPQIYYSKYPAEHIEATARFLIKAAESAKTWCIFDNTALGAAVVNAFEMIDEINKAPRCDG